MEPTPADAQKNEEIDRLVRQLGSRSLEKRNEAEASLRLHGPEAIAALVEALRRDGWKKAVLWGLTGVYTFLLVHAVVTNLLERGIPADYHTWQSVIIDAGFDCWLYRVSTQASQKQKRILSVLVSIQEIEAVGPLAEMLNIGNGRDWYWRSSVEAALVNILPRLKASDVAVLSPHQRVCLYQNLVRGQESFILALLSALEQIGDSSAIPYVEKLRLPKPPESTRGWQGALFSVRTIPRVWGMVLTGNPTCTPWSPHIQEAVERCLESLHQKAEKEQVSGTLLRAAGSPEPGAETLLRPAAAGSEVDPNELLRAGIGKREA